MRHNPLYEILGGPVYQWDTDRRLRIRPGPGETITEVHFARATDPDALVVIPTGDADGGLVASVPNILLQTAQCVSVYVVDEDSTRLAYRFAVRPRPKPEDYVYTETEALSYETLDARVKALEDVGGGGGAVSLVESLDTENMVALRDLESGSYVLSGRFVPYAGADSTMLFSSNLVVNVIKRTNDSHIQVFYPYNNCVQHIKITDTDYTRTNVYLNDLIAPAT